MVGGFSTITVLTTSDILLKTKQKCINEIFILVYTNWLNYVIHIIVSIVDMYQ